jgi:membrane-associated phospholipid phosphatase
VDGTRLRPDRLLPAVGGNSDRPLLRAAARRWAAGVLACCAVIVAALGALFAHQSTADAFDRAIDKPIFTWFAAHHDLALRLAAPGSLAPAAVLTAVIVVGCLVAGRLNGAVLALAAVPVAEAISEGVLKPLIHRTYLGGLVYPSGHTTAITALTATLFVLLVVSPQAAQAAAARARVVRWLRSLVLVAACVLCAGVTFGLIGLRWHYFTDIVAGAAVGVGTVCGLALILDLGAVRRVLARSAASIAGSANRWRSSGRSRRRRSRATRVAARGSGTRST